jgi:DNA-binding Lrp family transcriptional regulator
LNVAVGTIHNRVKRLKDQGIIQGFIPLLNAEKIGYPLTALILIQAEGGYLSDVEKQLAKRKEAFIIYDITGEHDIAIIARFKNKNDLNRFIKETIAIKHVERTETSLVLNIIKEEYRFPI